MQGSSASHGCDHSRVMITINTLDQVEQISKDRRSFRQSCSLIVALIDLLGMRVRINEAKQACFSRLFEVHLLQARMERSLVWHFEDKEGL